MTLDELGEDYAVCSVVLTARHRNAYGGVMGGVIFTLADYAFAAASNNIHRVTVAMQVSINYLSAPKGEKLTATAKCIKDGKTSMVVNVDIVDDTGRAVAQFVGTGFKL
ncbi:MAG: PaaI family thioesterase [Lachnospiraceae bacterium]|nr:PaaI family thioesterase [Lachnospiraceae bacterium]